MSHNAKTNLHRHQRHSSSSSLQNLLLLDDSDDNNSGSSVIMDDRHHHHHHHHHHDDNDDDLKDLADSCCSDGDVFDPPAWRPGRFLQFADIDLSVEDEPSVRPVSLPTERMGPHGHRCSGGSAAGLGEGFVSAVRGAGASSSFSQSFAVQMDSEQFSCIRHWRPSVTRRTLVLVTSCMTVAFTALTLLSFVLS